MRDSEENLKKFVKIVERYPILYFGYNCVELGNLWETVASSVRLEIREECTVEELKYKWKAMRWKYVYYAKKLSRGGKLTKQKEYDLYNTLSFLYPHAAARYTDILKCPPLPIGSNYLGPSTRSGDLGQITEDGRTSIKTEAQWDETEVPLSSKTSSEKYLIINNSVSNPDNLGQSTTSDDLRKKTRSGHFGQTSRSDYLGQTTTSDDLGQSTEECSTAIKTEVIWDLTEDPTSSDSASDMKPNMMQSINLIKVENFPDDITESTSFDVQETEENLDLQFFRSILPDISNFTPQEKRQFKMGVLKLIDEIEETRK